MRHIRYFTAISVGCVLLSGCLKEDIDPFNIPEGALILSTEGFISNNAKTGVEGAAVHWVNGDQIRVNGVNGTVTTGTGVNVDKAYATGDWNLSSTVRAYYPATLVTSNENSDNPRVNFPSRFASSFNGNRQVIALPMVGRAPANADGVKFRHLSAAVNVRVRNNTGAAKLYLDSVTVSSANQQLCGTANVTLGSNPAVSGTGANSANKSVTVYFPTSTYIANGAIRDVQVPIMPIAAGELTFKVYCHTLANEEYFEGVCPAHIEYNYSRALSNGALGRNVMATAQLAVTADGYTTRIDHSVFTGYDGRQICFSKGNLRCLNIDGDRFLFQNHQTGTYETADQNVGTGYSYTGEVGLFGFATSGYKHNRYCYSPWSTSSNTSDYYAYNNSTANLYDNTGQADWGYNPIYNGGNHECSGWFTPRKEDWEAIVFTRSASTVQDVSNARHMKAWVYNESGQNIKGMILFPDNFVNPFPQSVHNLWGINATNGDEGWSYNVYSCADWQVMEAAGAVFLPCNYLRYGEEAGSKYENSYWSSTSHYVFSFEPACEVQLYNLFQEIGAAVRLVRIAGTPSFRSDGIEERTDGGNAW